MGLNPIFMHRKNRGPYGQLLLVLQYIRIVLYISLRERDRERHERASAANARRKTTQTTRGDDLHVAGRGLYTVLLLHVNHRSTGTYVVYRRMRPSTHADPVDT